MARIRSLADARVMFARAAPCVMLPASATCTNSRRSVRSNLMDMVTNQPLALPEASLAHSALCVSFRNDRVGRCPDSPGEPKAARRPSCLHRRSGSTTAPSMSGRWEHGAKWPAASSSTGSRPHPACAGSTWGAATAPSPSRSCGAAHQRNCRRLTPQKGNSPMPACACGMRALSSHREARSISPLKTHASMLPAWPWRFPSCPTPLAVCAKWPGSCGLGARLRPTCGTKSAMALRSSPSSLSCAAWASRRPCRRASRPRGWKRYSAFGRMPAWRTSRSAPSRSSAASAAPRSIGTQVPEREPYAPRSIAWRPMRAPS